MVKILMRADTHININVSGTQPKGKCTWTQVCDVTVLLIGGQDYSFAYYNLKATL
jgi:hypothetical protein